MQLEIFINQKPFFQVSLMCDIYLNISDFVEFLTFKMILLKSETTLVSVKHQSQIPGHGSALINVKTAENA